MDLKKANYKFELRKAKDAEQGIVEGYASVYGVMDSHNSVIVKGAFADTLKNKTRNIKVYFNHDEEMPIGKVLEAREDDIGLFVRIKLTTNSELGNDVYALCQDEVIDSMSISFYIKDDEMVDNVWHIKKVELREISLVNEPSNPLAVVTNVRGERGGLSEIRRLAARVALLNLIDRVQEGIENV